MTYSHYKLRAFDSKHLVLGVCVLFAVIGCTQSAMEEPSTSGPVSAQLTLSTNEIHVGDAIVAELVTYHPAGSDVRVPGLGTGKDVVVRNRDWHTDELDDGRARTTARYDLTSFRVGTHSLTEENISCELSDGEKLTIAFPYTNITVLSVLSGEHVAPADIKGLASWPATLPKWLWALLLVAILAVGGVILADRLLGKPRTIIQQAPPPPAHRVALSALERLRRDGLIEREDIEPFYVRLSGIVRHYIEDRFGLHAPEQTTEEFIWEATRSQLLSSEHQKLTHAFLEQSDLVKFARHTPAREDMESALASGERLVRETIPAEPTDSATGGEG